MYPLVNLNSARQGSLKSYVLVFAFSVTPFVFIPANGLAQEAIDSAVVARIHRKVKSRLMEIHAAADFPGGSFAMVLPDKSEIAVTVGFASKEEKIPMKNSDRMMSASIGKTYFAAITLDLIKKKKLSLDDKVSRYLGDQDWFSRIPNADEVTIAHLMRHQSGIPRYILVRKVWKDALAEPDKQWQPGQQLVYIYDAKPLHQAGDGWAYSDTNFILLGLILEKISGDDVYRYVKDKFLRPHQLRDTVPNNKRRIPGLIQGYTRIFQMLGVPERVVVAGQFVFNPAMEWCGGGFASTSADLARWAHVLFSGSLLGEGSIKLMTSDAVPAAMLGAETLYGLGVMVRSTKLGKLLGHDGGFPGYTSTMGYFPKHKIAAAFMFNTDGPQAISGQTHQLLVELVEVAVKELTESTTEK